MSLYNDLLTAHAALKNENDALTLRAGQLERDVAFLRQQDRSKGEKMESLAAEKRKLEAELQVLRQQVTLGVKQVELIWSAKEKRLKQELDIAKKQLDPAQALVKASGVGTLLEKAAQMDELIAVKERHRQAAAEMQARKQVESLSSVFKASDDQALSAVVKSRAEDESEDGDFVGGSDSDSGSSSGESDDERSYDMAPSDIEAQNLSLGLSAVQYSDLPAAELVNTALASAEGILPGGLASISPAPVALGPAIAAPRRDGPDGHTSGDTTEVTTSVAVDTASVNIEKKDDSQQSGSSQSTRLIESEEILELDSGILESQLAYPCNWGQSSGAECRKLFASQRVSQAGRVTVFQLLTSLLPAGTV